MYLSCGLLHHTSYKVKVMPAMKPSGRYLCPKLIGGCCQFLGHSVLILNWVALGNWLGLGRPIRRSWAYIMRVNPWTASL